MKIVNARTLIALVLMCILGMYGRLLAREVEGLGQYQTAMARASHDLVFVSDSGIDVSGRLVSPFLSPENKQVIAFMLRAASIATDVDYWNKVQTMLPKRGEIRLIGFCDGDLCASMIRSGRQSPTFPVIAYGEAVASQALFNADSEGKFILVGQNRYKVRTIEWRSQGQTPSTVVRGVLR